MRSTIAAGQRARWSAAAACVIAIAVPASLAGPGSWALPIAAASLVAILTLAGYLALTREKSTAGTPDAVNVSSDVISEQTRHVLEAIDDPLLLLDHSSRVLFANAATQGLIRPEATGKRLASVLRTPELIQAIEKVQTSNAPQHVPFTVRVPVQRHLQAHVSQTAERQVLVHIHDITDIRRAEELRADFVANASHELRTPLAALTGFIDTLRGHAKDDPEARERFLEIMSGEAGRMRRLIDDLLSLTKIELNEHNRPEAEVDIVATVHDAAAALKPLADSANVTLDIEPHEPIYAIGERDELTQLFQNVLHNAIKYGREGGSVRARFGITAPAGPRRERQISVAIQDEGEGIPREAIPRLTERFYRVDVKRSREKGGTGLGLAIVKHILNRHRGRLEIDSIPGQGSTFTAYLPATPRMAAD